MSKPKLPKISLFARAGMVAASVLMALPINALACSGIYVGPSLTADGATYLGRSEDYGNGARYRKVFGIKEASADNSGKVYENSAEKKLPTDPHFRRPVPNNTLKYTYVTDSKHEWGYPEAYAEAGINSAGVAISATVTTDYGEAAAQHDPLVATGVTEFNLGSILLGESHTAKEAVEIAGKVIDEYGSGECYQFFAADDTESWLFIALSGHQWLGIKLGSNVVSCNPNLSTLSFKVDLNSPDVLHSAGISTMPEEKGFIQKFEDGTIDIAKTYGEAEDSSRSLSRYFQCAYYWNPTYAQGLNVVANADSTQISSIDNKTLFFDGTGNYDTFKILRSLGTQGENSGWDSTQMQGLYAVGNNRQLECHFFQARQNQGLDKDLAIIEWLAPSRAEYSIYIPMYAALLTQAPSVWAEGSTDAQTAPDRPSAEQTVEEAMQDNHTDSFIYVAQDLNTLANVDRENYGAPIRAYFDEIQKEIIAQQKAVDEIMQTIPADERAEKANLLNQNLTSEVYGYMNDTLKALRSHIATDKQNNTVTPFSTAELNPVSDLIYSEYIDTPVIKADKIDYSFTVGEKASPIELSADAAYGSVLNWTQPAASSDRMDRAASEGVTGSSYSFTPSTDAVGETDYEVRVANRDGSSDSVTIHVSVTEKKEDDNGDNSTKPTTPTKPNKASTKALPKTSDVVLPIAATSFIGLSFAAVSYAVKKRNK